MRVTCGSVVVVVFLVVVEGAGCAMEPSTASSEKPASSGTFGSEGDVGKDVAPVVGKRIGGSRFLQQSVRQLVATGAVGLDDPVGRFFSGAGLFQAPSLAPEPARALNVSSSRW